MKTSLEPSALSSLCDRLTASNTANAKFYRGDSGSRQPVHTVYGGAQLFKRTTTAKIGELAAACAQEYLADGNKVAKVFGVHDGELAQTICNRVNSKLNREAVEDFRIDFEDGFGVRSDAEEDDAAVYCAQELAAAWQEKSMSPFSGIRVKCLGEETKMRSLRTLDLFVTSLAEATSGKIDPNFVITLPKITTKDQVTVFVDALNSLESALSLPKKGLAIEYMIETPQTVFVPSGEVSLPNLVNLGEGRVRGAHFGTYDYTASMDVTASQQRMDHPACDFARSFMKVGLAGTGIYLSDGATNIMPVTPHKTPSNDTEREQNHAAIEKAWKLSHSHIMHSLTNGFFQGWDLHPAQLPVRYATLYQFFLEGLAPATERLRNFIEHAAKATLVGDVFDDAATGQGLLNYFIRARSCGAIEERELQAVGLTESELATKSFLQIVRGRQS